VELIEETVDVGPHRLRILRPPEADALIDEERFGDDEFLPYWAELWPSGVALARVVAERDLRGARVVELGCGLGIPSVVAALGGAHALATDWAPEALELAAANGRRNGAGVETLICDWRDARELVERAPWDLVLAADVLYEHRNVEPLLDLLPRLARDVLIAEPGRPFAREFFERAEERWTAEPVADRVVALTRK
jgi:predicted nicotinamide N-methyase